MLDTLGKISRTDIRSLLGEWEKPTPLPFYSLGEPTLTIGGADRTKRVESSLSTITSPGSSNDDSGNI